MRIISKFNDYYDRGAAHGVDTSVVYVRETKELEEKEIPQGTPIVVSDVNYTRHRGGMQYSHRYGYIAFCGKMYPYVIMNRMGHLGDPLDPYINEDTICYSQDELNGYCITHDIETGTKHRSFSWLTNRGMRLFESRGKETPRDLCIKNGWSIYDYQIRNHQTKLTINPNLSKFGFYRVMDPYTAFQELDMWISGVLPRSGNPMVEISDKERAVKHGFDKWSFRKPPKEKK